MAEANLKSEIRNLKSGGVVVPQQPDWRRRMMAWAIYLILRAVTGTVRCRLEDDSGFFSRPRSGAVIFCFWHNRLAMCMQTRARYGNNRTDGNKIAALVSASRDGGLLSRVLELFDVQPVRGSSSRRGPQALREMVSWGERGYDLAITPDGPRGPRYVIQEGVTALAQLTGLPIVPVSFNLSRKILMRSWDRFQVPLPFTRCEVWVESPIFVPREATAEQREQLRRQLENRLRKISRD